MNNNLEVFRNSDFGNVRVKLIDEIPMFCLSDVCKSLDIKNVSACKTRLNSKGIVITDTPTNGGKQSLIFITEMNVYKCIFQSRRPDAEKFQDWVCDEVLPSIRRNGGYIANQKQMTPEQIVANALVVAQNIIENQKKELAQAKPKVEFFDAVTGSSDTIDMRTVATVLNCGLGRNRIFEVLRDKKILDRKNIPYQQYIDKGYFRTIESTYSKPDGTKCINIKTVIFQKGLDFIRKTLKTN